ncbi:uncharacterized protein LOC123531544 [Mercenaria mercenaria]|uniref:uncharacterized protein LOC123531544 n=1 Tax=Mercenaria mercenaria TaxID=6596 RepID=UPI00234F62A0|nr:uncharacterized protein LOC123531544 [Mercenaria mercenaria]
MDAWKQHKLPPATDILLDRLMKHPNWLDDTIRALRDPRVGLFCLADAFEGFTLTVPVHWNICLDKDKDADSLFNKVVGDKPANDKTIKPAPVLTELNQSFEPSPMKITTAKTTMKLKTEPVKQETELHYDETDVSRMLPDGDKGTDVLRIPKGQDEIWLKKEDLHAKLMEKLYSCIQSPKDLPVALHYMDKLNLHMDTVEVARDRVTFSIYICSLDALQTLEQLWRYGGLKRLLDKEMMDQFMLTELRAVAVKAGHPVVNIQSHLEVYDADIERCRSSLIKGFRPMDVANISVLSEKCRSKETMLIREVAIFAIECLPDELKHILEDPFVSDRVSRFFESIPLGNKFRNEHEEGSASIPKSVAQYFTEWLNDELVTYLTNLDNNTKQHLLSVAVYLVYAAEADGTVAIPYDAMSETYNMKEVKTLFHSESQDHGYWGDLIKLPNEMAVDTVTLHIACKDLMTKSVLRRSKNNIDFLSHLVRDVFVAKVISCTSYKGSLKTVTDSFEYVQTLIGLFEMEVWSNVSDKTQAEVSIFAFKTDELREIGIPGKHKLTVDCHSNFYTKDLMASGPGTVEVTNRISDAGEKIKRCLNANAQTKHISVDISEVVDDDSLSLEAGLHWLNTATRRPFEKRSVLDIGKDGRCYDFVRGLSISKKIVTGRTLSNVGLYVNVTPSLSVLSLTNCQLKSDLLRNVLQTGHFRNIIHLNISDNDIFQGSCQQMGLMNISSLERFEIQNCSLGDDGIKLLTMDLRHMEKLRELNIANNRVTSRGLLALTKALSRNRWISSLRIHKNYIGEERSLILASWLESLLLLEVLNISECGIGDKGSPIIANALVSRSLMKLSMRKNGLTPKGSRDFFKHFQRPVHLDHLDFSKNTLFAVSDRRGFALAEDLSATPSDEPFLQFLQHPTPMSHLSLWNTCVGQKRLFQGSQIIRCFEQMTYLCLQENNLSDDFAKDVANCICQSKCSYLQHFNLRQNHIGNKGAIDIAKALSEQKYLKEVLLDRNEIGDDGANQIVSSCISIPSIERIDLSCNNISRKMMDNIVTDMAKRIQCKQGNIPEYEYSQCADTNIIKTQHSFDENSFNIKRDGEKFFITM